MNSVRTCLLVILCVFLPGPTGPAVFAEGDSIGAAGQALESGDVSKAVQELLSAVKSQQSVIETLNQRVGDQEKTIQGQQESIEVLGRKIADQAEVIARQEEVIANQRASIEKGAVAQSDIMTVVQGLQKADELYESAYRTRRTGIFDAPRRDKERYFQRAIEQFRKVVELYPSSRVAPEAQYEIAHTFRRWLGDSGQAVIEFRKVIEGWPDSPSADQAREALSELGASAPEKAPEK